MNKLLNKCAKAAALAAVFTQSAALFAANSRNAELSSFQPGGDSTSVIYNIVEEMPEFPGGDEALRKYINDNLKYPEEAKELGLEGKVYIHFVINENGEVEDAQIARGADPILDKEAIRVVQSLPKWKPGKKDGRLVKVAHVVPVNFSLKRENATPVNDSVKTFGEIPIPIENDSIPFLFSKKNSIGTVYVHFTINKYGVIEDIYVKEGINPALNEEAIKIVKNAQGKWPGAGISQSPGKKSVSFVVPITFTEEEIANFEASTSIGFSQDTLYSEVDEMPEYPGGKYAMEMFIAQNMQYPKRAKSNGVQGKVVVLFAVNKEGGVENVQVAQSAHPLLDKEAIRVIKSLPKKFKPGKLNGEPVNVLMTVPLNFSLN